MAVISKIDEKGRVLIPAHMRRRLPSKIVRLRVEGDKIIIEPVKDPIERLVSSVKRGTKDVSKEIRGLRKVAEEQIAGEVGSDAYRDRRPVGAGVQGG